MVSSSEFLRLGEDNGGKRVEGTSVGDFTQHSAQDAVDLLEEIANATKWGTVGLTEYLNQIRLPRLVYAEYLSAQSNLTRAAEAGIMSIWERGRLCVPAGRVSSSERPPKPPASRRLPDVLTRNGEVSHTLTPEPPPFSPPSADDASHVLEVRVGAERRTVFDVLLETGHDDGFTPVADDPTFVSTDAQPGTREKIDVLAERVRRGIPMWHSGDRIDHDRV